VVSNDEYHRQGGRDEVETQRSVASMLVPTGYTGAVPHWAVEPGQRMGAYATRMLRNTRVIRNTQALN
jgi:hypothetical protein